MWVERRKGSSSCPASPSFRCALVPTFKAPAVPRLVRLRKETAWIRQSCASSHTFAPSRKPVKTKNKPRATVHRVEIFGKFLLLRTCATRRRGIYLRLGSSGTLSGGFSFDLDAMIAVEAAGTRIRDFE